jgi:hypothetical protein
MTLTDSYRFERLGGGRSKTRFDCTASTGTYPDFEEKGFIYIGVNDYVKASRHRKSDLSVTNGKGRHITSIFSTDMENGFAYGDNNGTTDLLLFVFQDFNIEADGRITDGAIVEIFVARGKKFEKNQINNLFLDGQLDSEISDLRLSIDKPTTDKTEQENG